MLALPTAEISRGRMRDRGQARGVQPCHGQAQAFLYMHRSGHGSGPGARNQDKSSE